MKADVMQPVALAAPPLSPEEILALLKEGIDSTRILIREIDRIAFASDASFYRLIPRAVVQPSDAEEVRHLFRFSHDHSVPLVFRAGGTSLSGQSITDGVLVDVGRYWRSSRVEENGKRIRVQPGVLGQYANDSLRLYRAKIGPDPASISSCRLGGILSNNASGMCCGVAQNAYHTLRSLTFVLPSGTEINTAHEDADTKFRELEPELYNGLLKLQLQIANNPAISNRIRRKYLTKNTTGYGLNAFLDFDRPVDIFSHLLIGAEGTLAFVAEAVLNTVPDNPIKYTGLLLFADLRAACSAIGPLRDAGAAALELMDRAAMRSVEEKPGVSPLLRTLPAEAAGLLVEFQCASERERQQAEAGADAAIAGLDLLHPPILTHDSVVQAQLWKIRKGMFPSVGAVRESGTTVIIEDVAFPVERLADAAVDLRVVLDKHGYKDAILFGHAKDGNLHFVITQGFRHPEEIRRYREFIDDIVELVVARYDGALKAEHGTGRNMAPFVETEWGPEPYAIMRQIKALADPTGLLNPGVILNSNPEAHISDLKDLPVVEPEVDKCIECGYCEHNCPSRDITLTPRQRIVVRREMQRLKDAGGQSARYDGLDRDFPYMALDTCAVDGLCALECPVSIDTGTLTKRFRRLRHTSFANSSAALIAKNFGLAEIGARIALTAGHLVRNVFGLSTMVGITKLLNAVTRSTMDEPFWQWSKEMPKPRRGAIPVTPRANAQAVYFPACIARIMGALPGEPDDITAMQAFLNIAQRSNISLYLPPDTRGNCCGVPFSSKGFEDAHCASVNHTIENFFRWSGEGAIPILVDTSPCTYGLKTARPYLTPENQAKFDRITILDTVEFAGDHILPRLPIHRKVHSVALHPVCSAVKMGITAKLVKIAQACSDTVVVPDNVGCCAFAGDRGFLFPELTASATSAEAEDVAGADYDGYYSSSRTCEIGMTRATGKVYRSFLHLLDHASRP